jgi:hypothetical protein
MNTNNSTYSLIERSRTQDKNRTLLEAVLFTMSILAAIVSIWQFAHERVVLPENNATQCIACVTPAEPTHI